MATKRVVLIGYPGAQALDLTGPAEVFASAGRGYRVVVAAGGGGPIRTSSGIALGAADLFGLRADRIDTAIVAGAPEAAVRAALDDTRLERWLARAPGRVRRVASVCSGAFLLAAAGVLDGKRATTHWAALAQLAELRPAVAVDRDAIFVRDGGIWTSAGVSTGIDMALAMVEDDLGTRVADAVAAQLVLYLRRPGFQSQFSQALAAQGRAANPLGRAVAWARGHLAEVDVEGLAAQAGLSLRTLHRRCLEHEATTPAKLLDRLRVEHARTLLATTASGLKEIAATCGFGGPVRMKRAFERELGLAPRSVRLLFGGRRLR